MAKDDLINLAKSGKPTTGTDNKSVTKKTTKKAVVKKPVIKEPTPEELRDKKAKETVQKLLEDSPITTLDKKEELIVLEEPVIETPKGVEWLEEQVTLLTSELTLAKEDYKRIFNENQNLKNGSTINSSGDGNVKTVVIQLFNELQENHIKLGVDSQGVGNFRIYCPGFLNRMIKFFPFLEEVKRYQ